MRALKEIMDLLEALISDFERAKNEKENLEKRVEVCKAQLLRARLGA